MLKLLGRLQDEELSLRAHNCILAREIVNFGGNKGKGKGGCALSANASTATISSSSNTSKAESKKQVRTGPKKVKKRSLSNA